jgi:signal transduction histidine kinase
MMPEAQRMAQLVDDLLLLARADERGLSSRREDVDLDQVLEVEGARLRAEGVVVRLDTHPARVWGDHEQLTRVIRNLADNAARHATSRVVLQSRSGPGYAVIRVIDDGPGIPPADRRAVKGAVSSPGRHEGERDTDGAQPEHHRRPHRPALASLPGPPEPGRSCPHTM